MDSFDLLIVGGGINGAAIARDAAGRGASVLLVERDDLAAHTSSASSKLAHGGLRYLEQRELRLVRESLHEREILLRTAPHIVRPLRFVLPDPPGGRPTWMIRAGLLAYDLLAGRSSLPRARGVPKGDPLRAPLDGRFRCLSYWDAWADDARLVVLNAVDAAERGAEVATRTELLSARREGGGWAASLSGGRTVRARMLVNAAGPWVAEVLHGRTGGISGGASGVRLVRGSHIVVPRIYQGEHAFVLQQPDGRIVFALPYGRHTLIGTTDVPVGEPGAAEASDDEIAYLCAAANRYFRAEIAPADVVWRYAGVRALWDDGSAAAKDVTRDYRFELDQSGTLLSVFGGKLTTARALASEALDRLGVEGLKFTRTSALPGGDVMPEFNDRLDRLAQWMPRPMLARMAQAYGTRLEQVLGGASSLKELGRHFGARLYEAELRYLRDTEFARTADDVLWRRTKLGLDLDRKETAALARFLGG